MGARLLDGMKLKVGKEREVRFTGKRNKNGDKGEMV